MITIQILIKNNIETVKKTLDSIKSLNANIVVGDLGSKDGSVELCRQYGAEIISFKSTEDCSKIRNELIREGINFYIEPWESLIKGHEEINEIKENAYVYVVQNNSISKELRIWSELKFQNPVYETIVDKNAKCKPSIVIVSKSIPDSREEKIKLCKNWIEKRPTSPEPYYYLACSYLGNRQYNDFLSMAYQHMVMEKENDISTFLLHYYIAQIEFRTNNMQSAIKRIFNCIINYPTLAEFWCLLGDVLYKQQKYEKAKSIYQNAMIIGKRRVSDDLYPIEIEKYENYPRKMIENINSLKEGTNLIGVVKNN